MGGETKSDRAQRTASDTQVCAITGVPHAHRDLVALDNVRPSLARRILQDHPDLPPDAMIARTQVDKFRSLYVEELLVAELGEIGDLERQVADSITREETITANVEDEFLEKRTFGEVLSDHLASFGGSWSFLIAFGAFLVIWIIFNSVVRSETFDPFPFILLNLILSCLAAVQAPIIMMSQKRQEAKDRLRSRNDYRVNLKAELEIRQLHEKVDHLITKQWQRLAEIQQIQLEIMQERLERR